jgi:hypothetical protein
VVKIGAEGREHDWMIDSIIFVNNKCSYPIEYLINLYQKLMPFAGFSINSLVIQNIFKLLMSDQQPETTF